LINAGKGWERKTPPEGHPVKPREKGIETGKNVRDQLERKGLNPVNAP